MTERIPHPLIHENAVTFPGAKLGLQQARQKLLGLDHVKQTVSADPTLNLSAQKAELSKWASRNLGSGLTALAHAGEAIERRVQSINTEIALSRKPPTFQERQEIRQALRSMEPAKRRQILDQAIGDGDGPTVGAALSASPWLVGEDPGYVKMLEARWTNTHFKDQAQELRALSEDRKRVELATQAFEKILAEAEAPGREALAAAQRTKTVLEQTP